jgi:RND family efflux transporter MFP subunit
MRMTRERGQIIVLVAAIALLLAVGTAFGVQRRERRSGAAASPPGAPVAVARLEAFAPRVISTGSIRLLAGGRIEVGARISGVVTSLFVTQGTHVDANSVIARLDDRDARARVAQADAAVAEQKAAASQQRDDAARIEALAASGGVSGQELLAARTALATAVARLNAAQAALSLAKLQLDFTVIRAPISGIVASVTTHRGETVAASLAAPTFVTLLDPARIECVALVDESDIGHVQLSDSAEFTVDAFPGRIFRGVVSSVAPDATLIGGVVDYEVRIRIAGPVEALKPQMTASVAIVGPAARALVIPTAAIRQSALGTYVWHRNAGETKQVPIVVGARQSDIAEVRGGLAAGDSVLIGNFPEQTRSP